MKSFLFANVPLSVVHFICFLVFKSAKVDIKTEKAKYLFAFLLTYRTFGLCAESTSKCKTVANL